MKLPFLGASTRDSRVLLSRLFSLRLTGTSDLLGSLPTNLGYIGQKKILEIYQFVVSQILRSQLNPSFCVFLSESSYVGFT